MVLMDAGSGQEGVLISTRKTVQSRPWKTAYVYAHIFPLSRKFWSGQTRTTAKMGELERVPGLVAECGRGQRIPVTVLLLGSFHRFNDFREDAILCAIAVQDKPKFWVFDP